MKESGDSRAGAGDEGLVGACRSGLIKRFANRWLHAGSGWPKIV
jgi:hypothetical protein